MITVEISMMIEIITMRMPENNGSTVQEHTARIVPDTEATR